MVSGTRPGPAAARGVLALGLDVGTTNTKAALVLVDDAAPAAGGPDEGPVREVAVAAAPTPSSVPDLLATVARVLDEVCGRWPGARPAVVGVASMAETGVPLDAHGDPVTELLRWDGRRAGEQAVALARAVGADRLFAATGVRPSAKVPLATWAWLRDEGVTLERWAGAADVVVLALTGHLVTDHTLAGRTQGYRMPGAGEPLPDAFDPDLLALVGLAPDRLPRVAPPDGVAARVGDVTGPGLVGALRLDAVAAGTPVVVAGHDHAVGTWAAGVRTPGGRADSLGTAEAVLTVLADDPDPAAVAAAGMSWVRTASGRHPALLAGSPSAGAMLDWLAGVLAAGRAPWPGGRPAKGDPALADALAGAAASLEHDPGPTGLVVLPYLAGRQAPAPDPTARVRAVRLPSGEVLDDGELAHLAATDPALLARAVLDGVCLQARWMLAEQARLGDVAGVAPAAVLPGGARDVAAWVTTKQRLAPDPLTWVTTTEPVAVGAAVLGAARAGLLGDPATALGAAPALPARATRPRPRADDGADDALAAFTAAALAG